MWAKNNNLGLWHLMDGTNKAFCGEVIRSHHQSEEDVMELPHHEVCQKCYQAILEYDSF